MWLTYRGKLWSPEKAQLITPRFLKYVDVCISNEEDAKKCLGLNPIRSNVENATIDKTSYIHIAKMINRLYGYRYIATTLRENYSANVNSWSTMLFDSNSSQTYFSNK